MANPRYDQVSQFVNAATSYTTSFEVLNYNQCAVQVIWSALDTSTGTVRLQASNDGSNYQNLTTSPITMTAGASNHMFNMYAIGYAFMAVYYDPGSNTAGTLNIKTVRKSFS